MAPDNFAEMHADALATREHLSLERAARAAVEPAPSLTFDDYPRDVAKREIRVDRGRPADRQRAAPAPGLIAARRPIPDSTKPPDLRVEGAFACSAQWNESPHAHEPVALGLSMVNPCFSMESTKSIMAPLR